MRDGAIGVVDTHPIGLLEQLRNQGQQFLPKVVPGVMARAVRP